MSRHEVTIADFAFSIDMAEDDEVWVGGIATMLSEAIEERGTHDVIYGCWWRYGGLPVYDGEAEIARVTVYG